MLLQLLPRDITKHWEGLSGAISKSLPPITSATAERMVTILKSLVIGVMQCWVLLGPDSKMCAIITTEIVVDSGSKTKNLLIFSLYGLQAGITQEMWGDGYGALRKFARAHSCESIIAFTDVSSVIKIVEGLGGNADTRLLVMGVDDGE